VRAAALLLAGFVAWPAASQTAQTSTSPAKPAQSSESGKPAPPAPPAKKNPLLKLIEPWPAPEKMKERRETAEALPLFAAHDVLPVTLVGDFKAINKDHDPNSKQLYPGVLRTDDNKELQVKFRARGHVRRLSKTCDYVPLKVEFVKKETKGTVFAEQDALKLVVQCSGGGDYEQYVLREFLAYRIYNVVTHRSFRARLAKVTYVDRASGKTAGTRLGMFLEDEGDVARRMEGRVVDLQRLTFANLQNDSLMPTMIFEYMIGNTDMSIYALHNMRIVQMPDKSLHVVPYDFDYSGLVNAPYAIPARGFLIKTVTERIYRGPCRNQELVDPYVANFLAKKDLIRALPDQIPGFSRVSRDDARNYIDSFYSSVDSPKDVRGLFVNCSPKTTM
jgi:hypothetical protein